MSNIDPSRLQMDPRIRQQYMLYMQQQHQRQRGPVGALDHSPPVQTSPTHSPHSNHIIGPPRVPPTHRGPVPKVCVTSHENDTDEVKKIFFFFFSKTHNTPVRRQSKTLSTIDERGSKIDRNSVLDSHFSPVWRQMAIENTVSIDFYLCSSIVLAFSIAAYLVCISATKKLQWTTISSNVPA